MEQKTKLEQDSGKCQGVVAGGILSSHLSKNGWKELIGIEFLLHESHHDSFHSAILLLRG